MHVVPIVSSNSMLETWFPDLTLVSRRLHIVHVLRRGDVNASDPVVIYVAPSTFCPRVLLRALRIISLFSKIQLVIYYQCCVLIG